MPNNDDTSKKKKYVAKNLVKELNYPAIGIKEAVKLIKKAAKHGKDKVMTFDEICRYMGIKGGSRSRYMASLRLYGLVEKIGTGWILTDIGKGVADENKQCIIDSFLTPRINKLIRENFKMSPSLASLISFLNKQHLKINSKIIAKRYLEGMEFIKDLLSSEELNIPRDEQIEIKTYMDIFKAVRIIGCFSPVEDMKDEKIAANALYKLAKKNNWQRLTWLLEALKDQESEIIKKSSQKIIEAFEKDSKIKISDIDITENNKNAET
ncbi:MAG: hypothetical protein J7K26_04075 [Candidatus Aenigmarchaeota archaeon]|nr:hypothetical protein [Candidatus Aenigmarchaeota archaeon]